MKVNELIERLQKIPDQDTEVLVNVHVCTRAFGVAQITPWDVDEFYGAATIEVTLPEGMSVAKRA